MKDTHCGEIYLHQFRDTIKSIIQRRHITAYNQAHNARIVQFIPPLGHFGTMVTQRMKRRTHAQTQEGACKETAKHENVGPGSTRVAWRNELFVGIKGSSTQGRKQDGTGEVRPDIDRLIVQGEDGREGALVAVACGAVAGDDEGIVTAPFVEVVPG